MNELAAGAEFKGMDSEPANAEYLFMSSHCGIRGHGVFERLLLPVKSGDKRYQWILGVEDGSSDDDFHRQLRAVFQRARQAGIANPVAIGAIPFDQTQPAEIAIPLSYEVFSRTLRAKSSVESGRVRQEQKLPRVLHHRSLPEKKRFKQAVKQIIANFSLSDIRKAVLSRMLELELDGPVHLDTFFNRLIALNPSAYHFRLPLSNGTQLIGASPELLLRRQGAQVYTNPLAGSAKRQGGDAAMDKKISEKLTQSAKDAYEHRLVIEDIRAQLAPLCSEITIPESPQLMQTSTMWHLSTPISGTLADPGMTALQLACRLHPTPALCGFPTEAAQKLIQLVEPFDRGVFGGIVGWCDAQGNGEWAVAIRCGLFAGRRVQLFAGAGIVAESDPESEWQETQAKLQTMLNALGIDPGTEAVGQCTQAALEDTARPQRKTSEKVMRAARKLSDTRSEVPA